MILPNVLTLLTNEKKALYLLRYNAFTEKKNQLFINLLFSFIRQLIQLNTDYN